MSVVEKSQYDIEYDAAMAKLEAGEPITSQEEVVIEPEGLEQQEPDELQALKEKLEKQEKALKDTQRWAHKNSAELAALKREREQQDYAASRPSILDDNPGLEEAIKHVAAPKEQSPNAPLVQVLEQALPELDGLLNEPDFKERFMELRKDSIDTWLDDPLSAIRDISSQITNYQSEKAVANAQKDYQTKQRKLSSMSVPGGSGGKGISKEVDEAQAIREMSTQDFNKMRAKTLGY